MKRFAAQLLRRALSPIHNELAQLRAEVERNRVLAVQSRIREFRTDRTIPIEDAGFSVFSQWGEDGILQYLLARVPIENDQFVEFGVEDYLESNTRFLLVNDDWKGLVLDGDADNVARIRRLPLYWRHHLDARQAFITAENINALLRDNGVEGDIGLLSIDIDGNDYWVWRAINVVSPRIVAIEYNSVFGRHAVTVPYDPAFQRTRAHYSNLYWGGSLGAMCFLAAKKGYTFVGTNRARSNAFFVRSDVAGECTALSLDDALRESRARDSLDETGNLSFLSGSARRSVIQHLPVVNVETNAETQLERVWRD